MRNPFVPCRSLFFIGLLIATLFPTAKAQYEDGSLVGAVHDSTGAAVSNAAVTVTNISTGNVIKVTADASGNYEVPSLRVGVYNIDAAASGFAACRGQEHHHLRCRPPAHRPDAESWHRPPRPPWKSATSRCRSKPKPASAARTSPSYQTEALPLVSRNYSDLLALVTGSRQAPTAATTTAVTSLVRQDRTT